MVDKVEEKVEAFSGFLDGPALAIDARAVTTDSLEEAIDRPGEVLTDRINVHIDTLRRAHPGLAAYDQVNTLEKRKATRGGSDATGQLVEPDMESAADPITLHTIQPRGCQQPDFRP